MNILDSYKKNKKKHLKEVSGGEAAAPFVGGAGDFIDHKFAGPFHPDFGNIKKLLGKQIDFDILKRMWTDEITPNADIDWEEIDWKYEYDKYLKKDNSKFINTSDTEMQYVDIEIDYDYIMDKHNKNKKFLKKGKKNWKGNTKNIKFDSILDVDKSKFKSTSDTEMQYVDIGIKYDKTDDRAAKNKKFVNKTDEWKSIYENDTKKQVGEK